SARSETYYINPKASPAVCFARPNLMFGKLGDDPYAPSWDFAGPSSMWDPANGFIPQSTGPSSYGRNFPTTGANGLYFDLLITGSSQPLSWSPVSLGGITVTMSNPTATSVRVTLTGPYATESQRNSSSPSPLPTISLPQTFELVGRDSYGAPVVKYGFTLKQWFVNRGSKTGTPPNILSWCNSLGYRLVKVKDLTNAVRTGEYPISGASPSSRGNYYMRHIGAGFLAEWGRLSGYSGVGFSDDWYWTRDPTGGGDQFVVIIGSGYVDWNYTYNDHPGLCSHP
ncbi:hypothetical protein, partial [Gilliamella sp. B2911]|uniref:hypothetical protein n=1 Tax=Gilliamella sp. B2911 TaxID=2817980 RepID=UPI00226A4D15